MSINITSILTWSRLQWAELATTCNSLYTNIVYYTIIYMYVSTSTNSLIHSLILRFSHVHVHVGSMFSKRNFKCKLSWVLTSIKYVYCAHTDRMAINVQDTYQNYTTFRWLVSLSIVAVKRLNTHLQSSTTDKYSTQVNYTEQFTRHTNRNKIK